MICQVAYPNPSLRPLDRVCLYEIDFRTSKKGLLFQLYEEYPNHKEDLKYAIIWKVCPLSINHPMPAVNKPHRLLTSSSRSWMCTMPHCRKHTGWIRNKHEDAEILKGEHLVKLFPGGPHDKLLDQVDIVVVTPESTPLRANPNHSF